MTVSTDRLLRSEKFIMKYILKEEYKSLSNYGIVGVRRNIERSFKSCS